MFEVGFIRNLGIIIVAAAAVAFAGRRIRVPAIVAYLIAGLIVGPLTGLVHREESIDVISEIGIILLLFLVGLELNFSKIRSVAGVATVGALGQGALTTALAAVLARALGFPTIEAITIGILLSYSSTVIAVKLLGETNELDTAHGKVAVGVLLIQDLLVILMLTIVTGIGSIENISLDEVSSGLLRAFGGTALLIVVALFVSRFVLPRIFAWSASASDTSFVFSLAWCFVVVLGAEFLHLSLEIGAFLAGLGLGQLPGNSELHRRVQPLMNFFLAVFFVSLGVSMRVSPSEVNWVAAIALSACALLLKPIVFMLIDKRMRCSVQTSFYSSITMAQISEFSIILAGVCLSARLISPESMSVLGLVALITMSVSAYMIQTKEALFGLLKNTWLIRNLDSGAQSTEVKPVERAGHVIVIGMNSLGRTLVRRLHERGETVLAIDSDPATLADLPCETIQGGVEYLSLLLEADLPNASLVVSALQIEDVNDLLAHRCRAFGVPCSIHVIDLSVIDNLLSANVNYLMIPKIDGIKLQTRELRKMGYVQ